MCSRGRVYGFCTVILIFYSAFASSPTKTRGSLKVQDNHLPVLLHHFRQREMRHIHLYTTNLKDAENDMPSTYDYKGPIGKVYPSPTSGTVPLYQYKNEITRDNFYTTDLTDVQNGDGNKFVGIVGYVYSTPQDDSLPLYRYYSRTTSSHFYSTDVKEFSSWEFQRIQAYIFPQDYEEFSITPEHFLLIKEEFSKDLKGLEVKLEEQERRLKQEKINREKQTGFLLAHPMARLYSELNHRGEMEEFNTKTRFMLVRCKNLLTVPKSIDTLGTCVRIYGRKNCDGVVRAVYPGNHFQHDLTTGFPILSIGPCFEGPLGSYSTNILHNDIQQIKQKLGMLPPKSSS